MKKHSGFTLIELMVVMAIIAILATAGLSAYTGYIKKARDTVRLGVSQRIETAVVSFMSSHGWQAPTGAELITELDAMDLGWNITPNFNTTLAVSEVLNNILWVSHTYALTDPIGGKSVCLNASKVANQPCNYTYILFDDGTYAISYGIESESNMKSNFYIVGTITGVFRGDAAFIGGAATDYVPTGSMPAYGTLDSTAPVILNADGSSGGGGGDGGDPWLASGEQCLNPSDCQNGLTCGFNRGANPDDPKYCMSPKPYGEYPCDDDDQCTEWLYCAWSVCRDGRGWDTCDQNATPSQCQQDLFCYGTCMEP